MFVRIVLCRMKKETTEENLVGLLSAFKNAVSGAPGLTGFQIGRRVDALLPGASPGGPGAESPYDYAVMYQFETAAALRLYERRQAHRELLERFALVMESQIAGDYEM